jgi:hypothetical protein
MRATILRAEVWVALVVKRAEGRWAEEEERKERVCTSREDLQNLGRTTASSARACAAGLDRN